MKDKLPLFLLDTVLFPAMQLPLQVFEPRYLDMIGRCLEQETLFGVNLIREGTEVGGPADPAAVGTTARIVSSERQQDGRLMILAVGEQRYRILEMDRTRAYAQAHIELLDEPDEEVDAALVRRVMDGFGEALSEMGLRMEFDEELLEDARRVSYIVAAHIARGNPDKQKLLEMESVRGRLELEERWIAEVREGLQMRKQIEKKAGRNGKLRSSV